MTVFRRELLIERGPERLVVWRDSDRHDGLEVFTVDREGGFKQVPQLYTTEQLDWLVANLQDSALRDSIEEHSS